MTESNRSANLRELGCCEYHLLEEESTSCYITIICKFLNESELKHFEEDCNSNKLAENLKIYFMTVYKELGFPSHGETTKQLKFHVDVARILDSSMPQLTDAHNSLRFVLLRQYIRLLVNENVCCKL